MTEKRSVVMPAWVMLVAVVVLGAGALGIFVAGRQPAAISAKAAVVGRTETVRIPVQGMTCAVCAATVRKALQSLDGVQKAEIDLERREARVRYVEGRVSPRQLVEAIDKLGYKAGAPAPEVAR